MIKFFSSLVLALIIGSLSAQVVDTTFVETVVTEKVKKKKKTQESPDLMEELKLMVDAPEVDTTVLPFTPGPWNVVDIEDDDKFESFGMLDSIIRDYRLYFTGESHPFRESNGKVELKMFKYLYYKQGVRTLFVEFGNSRGYIINKYIQTGDSMLHEYIKTFTYDEYTHFYEKLRTFNDTLPADRKIQVVGVDLEREYVMPVTLLNYLLPKTTPPSDIYVDVESIRGMASYFKQDYDNESEEDDNEYFFGDRDSRFFSEEETLKEIIEHFKEKKEVYKTYLGDKYELFAKTISGIEDSRRWDEYNENDMIQSYVFREYALYSNILSFLKQNPNEKAFAQFGRCHVSKILQEEACGWYDYNSLAQQLISCPDTTVAGKVLTIGIFYPQGEYFDEDLDKYKGLDKIDEITPDYEMTLVALNKDTLHYGSLANMFNFAFFNKTVTETDDESNREFDYDYDYDFKLDDDYEGGVYAFYAGISIHYPNLTKLNSSLTSMNFNSLPKYLDSWQIGSSVFGPDGFGGLTEFGCVNAKTSSDTGSMESRFSGFNLNFFTGYDLFNSKEVLLAPMVGYGFSQYKQTFTSKTPGGGIWGNNSESVYLNPAFTLSGAATFQINVKNIFFSTNGGYSYDISAKSWRNSGKTVVASPETSHSGLFWSVNIGTFFTD